MTWQALDQSAGAIQITPPNFYAVVAMVKTNHSKADILSIAQQRGLTVFDYQEQPDDGSGYRQVAVQAQANAAATLPWSAPFPLSLADSSHITQAWWSPPTTNPASTQPAAAPASGVSPVVVAVGVGAAAGLIWWLFRRR